jgi:hypothetical protein
MWLTDTCCGLQGTRCGLSVRDENDQQPLSKCCLRNGMPTEETLHAVALDC